jgi:GTPase SAR1 family protein
MDREFKLLLLGGGESGKSTIAKQMKIIHLNGFTEEERKTYKDIIHSNVIMSMRALVLAAERLGVEILPENKERAAVFTTNSILAEQELTPKIGEHVKALWKDENIQKLLERSNEFQLNDSATYYFNEIDRLIGDFTPTEQDVLRARAKTTGITEIEFDIEQSHFRMVDVGGQRSERKKWIHCFQEVTAVIFCAALSEYDLKLYEDETVNRMHEALKLFDEICNSRWFGNTSIVLFLNKSDLFKDKIQKVTLSVCFPDYDGGLDYDKGVKYITEKFVNLNRDTKSKQVYPHVTGATDTSNIKFVFAAVKDIILNQAFSGFVFF